MTDDIIKQVPDILENPIFVSKSLQKDSRLTIFGEVYADGKPILAVLELDPTGRNGASLDEIKIASAYGKDNAQNLINRSSTLYVEENKNRVSEWEKRTGLQLPVGDSSANSVNSIAPTGGKVNSFSENSDKKLSLDADNRYSLSNPEICAVGTTSFARRATSLGEPTSFAAKPQHRFTEREYRVN